MKGLRTWSAIGGGAILASLLGASGGALVAHANRQAVQVDRREDRMVATERKIDALLAWARLVSQIEGWPVPPIPAATPEDSCGSTEPFLAATSP